MAFMARGHVPGQGPYGDNLNHAIDAILTLQQASGLIASRGRSHPMYEHGICTVALCEAYGMIDEHRQQLALAAIGRAVRIILDAQSIPKGRDNQGGWRYQTSSDDSDLSVGGNGWQTQQPLLRRAANVGRASIPQHDLDADGINYVKRRAAASGGFDYQGGSSAPNAALTGTGILALALTGPSRRPVGKAGGDFLLRTPIIQTPSNYFYTLYYCAQAAWQLGGQYWDNINREISSATSSAAKRPNGSWSSSASGDNEGGDNCLHHPPWRYFRFDCALSLFADLPALIAWTFKALGVLMLSGAGTPLSTFVREEAARHIKYSPRDPDYLTFNRTLDKNV